MTPSSEAEAVVQRQLDAYNARDLEALLATYSDGVKMFEHPNQLLASGKKEVRERFAARFQEPNLHAHLVKRMVMGDWVVDQEIVTRTFPEGPGKLQLLMIYQVMGGQITNAWVIPGTKVLEART